MSYTVRFYKDRFKFSSAHFTIFDDGDVERLHGHNYAVEVALQGPALKHGMLFPFHEVKPLIDQTCKYWDEYVLLPTQSSFLTIEERDEQVDVVLKTEQHHKRYSFPRADVRLLECDNITSENLAMLLGKKLANACAGLALSQLEVSVSESQGQAVTYGHRFA